jgi:hypothetical protein
MSHLIRVYNYLYIFNFLISLPDGRRFGHVNVVCSRQCSYVLSGRGEKRDNGVEQGD